MGDLHATHHVSSLLRGHDHDGGIHRRADGGRTAGPAQHPDDPHYNSWPDAASTPFRGEKNTNWEGGWRVPAMVRWPGHIPAGSVSNQIVHHMDWFPTLVDIAGNDDNLRRDPYERAEETSNTYYDWMLDRAYLLVPAQQYVGRFLSTFQEYPPRQEAASFSLDQVMEMLRTPGGAQ